MFRSTGTLKYSIEPHRLIVEVDDEIARYYCALTPKYYKLNKPLYPAHISLVRKTIPPNMEAWERHSFREVSFQYENIIYNDELYFWLNVYSLELESIRTELGLEPWGDVSLSPDFKHRFHITIGNTK